MKSQTFGVSIAIAAEEIYRIGARPLAGRKVITCGVLEQKFAMQRKTAIEDYRKNRENGGNTCNPSRPFPNDGKYEWVKENEIAGYLETASPGDSWRIRYTEGPGDHAWMLEKDRIFLDQLERERISVTNQPYTPKRSIARDIAASSSLLSSPSGGSSASGSVQQNRVIVHVWRPIEFEADGVNFKYSNITNMVARPAKKLGGDDQCGHVAITIIENNVSEYISYWPTKPGTSPGEFIESLEHDKINEGGRNPRDPDANIDLNCLSIDKIKQSPIYQAFKRYRKGTIQTYGMWTPQINLDAIDETSLNQNCASAIWFLLVAGGINLLAPSNSGPSNRELRALYKCDVGQVANGWFDGAFWRTWITSPVLILHLTAAAKENEMIQNNELEPTNTGGCLVL